MKKMVILFLSVLLFVTLSACSKASTTYTVNADGKTFEVDSDNCTIFDGTYIYEYEFSGDSSSYNIVITYPNGATYHWDYSGNFGHGGWSDNYSEEVYVDGDTLCDVIAVKAPKASNPGKVIAAIFLILIGAFNTAFPNIAWYLEYGWRYKNAEPSDFALGFNRVSGIIAIVVGILLFL